MFLDEQQDYFKEIHSLPMLKILKKWVISGIDYEINRFTIEFSFTFIKYFFNPLTNYENSINRRRT